MKFISYDRFKNIEFIKAGGFSKIYKATWIDGPHSWNEEKEDFEYEDPNIIVALKQLNNSENISFKELKELLMIYIADINNNFFNSSLYLNEYYGITQNPNTKDFIIIMKYYKFDLRNYITKSKDFYNIEWNKKLKILRNIAEGLKHLHNQGIIHRDLHSGNILCENDDDVVISDLGISKSAMGSTKDNESVYGIIPYMAPEILQRKEYTIFSDIYSFGMIMWELMTGRLPFEDQTIDVGLMSKICRDGLLPPITTNVPKDYIELMQECWNSDPIKRPEAANISKKLCNILNEEVSNPTEIIKSTDIAPIDNLKSKQSSNEPFTISSKELDSKASELYNGRGLVGSWTFARMLLTAFGIDLGKGSCWVMDICAHASDSDLGIVRRQNYMMEGFKQIIPSTYSLQYSDTNSEMIECEKNCNLCGNLKISSKYNIKLTLCSSCYLITSGWVELALIKVHIPILYLPWWDASDLCIVCDKVLEFKPERQNITVLHVTWNKKLYILWQISAGLHTIHENNFIHRDFHSGNILLETESFEIMKYTKSNLSETSQLDLSKKNITFINNFCYDVFHELENES
ncbi:kinase-like protein [Rhizophagus irregularis]|uniref:Kinase-like protein n=1 Tax=Rhizophagus irregularis TaxID=588596 RepID=A0A2I1GJN8_9GLOM|nr:kinase-like protein [Rhizophagus irregularis]